MSTLMLRHLSPELVSRIKAYAESHQLGYAPAAVRLLAIALDHLEARTAGGKARYAGTTAEERSDAMRSAARARWARRTQP